jgi:crotonobetainyl-CoA hydratase
MNSEFIQIINNSPVFEIVLNKPPANAIDHGLSYDLYNAFKQFNEDDSLRVAILHAEPNPKNIFCAGWDLKAFAQGEGQGDKGGYDLGPGGIGGLPEFWDLYKPVIAAVNGVTAGGGFEMVLGADLIVATENTEFFLPEAYLGYLADGGGIQKLPRRLPHYVAMDMLLTGRRMNALEAKQWGLVREVVSDEAALLINVRALAEELATAAPLAHKAIKEFIRFNGHKSVEQAHQASHEAWNGQGELSVYKQMLTSDDFDEGAKSFTEKRPPKFTGK